MLKMKVLAGCAVGLSTLAGLAHATVTVFVGGVGCSTCAVQNMSGAWQVEVTTGSQDVVVTGNSNDVIEYIVIVCSADGEAVNLTVGGSLSDVHEISRAVGSLGELWVTSVSATDIGDITANMITTVTASDDIYGHINQIAFEISESATGITTIQSTGGDITGEISATKRIGAIKAQSGAIGQSGSHAAISSADSIGQIVADSIYATISITGSAADLDSLITEVGVFAGSLSCRKITGAGTTGDIGLDVKGDLEADVTQTAAMDTDFRIWGSFASASEVDIHIANGLTRQVVWNNANASNTWSGAFKVNGTALSSPPYYTTPASSIGGGSVGLVPFNLHGVSCVPADGDTVATVYPDSCPGSSLLCDPEAPNNVANARKWVTMRMYGPVVFAGEGKPCTIERRVIGGSTWTNVTSDYRFDIYTSSDGDGTPDAGERVIRVRRESTSCLKYFPVGYDYRVRPVTDHVKCKGVNGGNTVNVYAFEYNFTLPYDCEESLLGRFDENGDDDLTSLDMAYLAVTQHDLNEDSAFNALDFDLMGRALAEYPH